MEGSGGVHRAILFETILLCFTIHSLEAQQPVAIGFFVFTLATDILNDNGACD
jgi:hypothetical protein